MTDMFMVDFYEPDATRCEDANHAKLFHSREAHGLSFAEVEQKIAAIRQQHEHLRAARIKIWNLADDDQWYDSQGRTMQQCREQGGPF